MTTLDQDRATLLDQGFVIVPDVLSRESIQGEYLGRNDFEGFQSERVYALLDKAPVIAELVANERILPLLDAVMQPKRSNA